VLQETIEVLYQTSRLYLSDMRGVTKNDRSAVPGDFTSPMSRRGVTKNDRSAVPGDFTPKFGVFYEEVTGEKL